jgi:hypothetical protein
MLQPNIITAEILLYLYLWLLKELLSGTINYYLIPPKWAGIAGNNQQNAAVHQEEA